jgi:MFS transporter, UMF1 family
MEEVESHRRPRYPGEDTRPTSEKELRGWYSYGFGAEVFAVVGVGMDTHDYLCTGLGLTI